MTGNDPQVSDPRALQGLAWARTALLHAGLEPAPPGSQAIAGDASFRRYFRLRGAACSWILMDAPPGQEDSRPFIDITARLQRGGIAAPEIIAADPGQGFLLLEDFGDALLRDALDERHPGELFGRLLQLLANLATQVQAHGLPAYDRSKLLQELELFPRWYLQRHKQLQFDCAGWDAWEDVCTRLLACAAQQPQVFVHRDFHSCNLLLTTDHRIGVIDFQDAVLGPLTYDFASLVWDRYISWPRARIEAWMEQFRCLVAPGTDPADWVRWCDWTGLQRNLKIVGIFARLNHRDGKAAYLELIPRFWGYVQDTLERYPEFAGFRQELERLRCAP